MAGDTCGDDCNGTLPGKLKSMHLKLMAYKDQSALRQPRDPPEQLLPSDVNGQLSWSFSVVPRAEQ